MPRSPPPRLLPRLGWRWAAELRCCGKRRGPSPRDVGSDRTSEPVSFGPARSQGWGQQEGVRAAVGHSWTRFLAAVKQEAAGMPRSRLWRSDTIEGTCVDAAAGNPTPLQQSIPVWRRCFRSRLLRAAGLPRAPLDLLQSAELTRGVMARGAFLSGCAAVREPCGTAVILKSRLHPPERHCCLLLPAWLALSSLRRCWRAAPGTQSEEEGR